jgi:hypothetical protein
MHVKRRQRVVHCPMTLFHDRTYASCAWNIHPAAMRPAEASPVAINSMLRAPLTPVAMRLVGSHCMHEGWELQLGALPA